MGYKEGKIGKNKFVFQIFPAYRHTTSGMGPY